MTNAHALDGDHTFDTYESTDRAEIDRPAAMDPVRSAPIVAALERAWDAIRHRHPDLPRVVMVVASGSDGAPAGWLKLGHFAAMRWQTGEGLLPEVFVGGEGLAVGPAAVLGTLLHEAAHAIADVRRIKTPVGRVATTTTVTPSSPAISGSTSPGSTRSDGPEHPCRRRPQLRTPPRSGT